MNIRNILSFNPRNPILKKIYIEKLQDKINTKNRAMLTNHQPTLVCSNCTGGFLYHWLGLRFRSPFINLFLWPNDFVTALENWDEFISSEILEIHSVEPYPIGKIITRGGDVYIHFMHYRTFEESVSKWNERKSRMEKDPNKIGFMLTNWENDLSILKRFAELPFKNKIAFTHGNIENTSSSFNLRGLEKIVSPKQVYYTSDYKGHRYIDQFDYIEFINGLLD